MAWYFFLHFAADPWCQSLWRSFPLISHLQLLQLALWWLIHLFWARWHFSLPHLEFTTAVACSWVHLHALACRACCCSDCFSKLSTSCSFDHRLGSFWNRCALILAPSAFRSVPKYSSTFYNFPAFVIVRFPWTANSWINALVYVYFICLSGWLDEYIHLYWANLKPIQLFAWYWTVISAQFLTRMRQIKCY